MGKRRSYQGRRWTRTSLALLLLGLLIPTTLMPNLAPLFRVQGSSSVGSVAPSTSPLLFGSSGNVRIDITQPGIAVRIEVPREFLRGVVSSENDTHFVTSNIRNDYYYYNVVDESKHWTYNWRGTDSKGLPLPSDGPCYKPTTNASFYDPNAPYCVEIWNYLNYPGFKPPDNRTNYCALPTQQYVFECFSAPRFVLFHDLTSPTLAGSYNFTISVANRTNRLGYPDFVKAWKGTVVGCPAIDVYVGMCLVPAWHTTFFVPVSMAYNAGFISGSICDLDGGCGPIHSKGIVYAANASTGRIVARAYVNQTLCPTLGVCGSFKLTGLAPGQYQVKGSAGVDNGVAYSLTPYGYPTPTTIFVSANSGASIGGLGLRRAPLVCGSINYQTRTGVPIRSLGTNGMNGNPYLLAAGFGSGFPIVNGKNLFRLNVTVEGTDPFGHVFRYVNNSTDTTSDPFNLTMGVGVKYVGTDPYGTEFAGLPAPEDVVGGRYALNVKVWVSGYLQVNLDGSPEIATAQVFQSPGSGSLPTCPNPPGTTFSPNPVIMRVGGVITGTLQFCNTPPATQTCNLESPEAAEMSLPIAPSAGPRPLFAGNIMIRAYDASGILKGITIVAATFTMGHWVYPGAICTVSDAFGCNTLRFYVIGFSEYYNHSLSGVWQQHDTGLPDGAYSLQVYGRGYELTSTNPASIGIQSGSNTTVTVIMTRGGAFQVTVGSFDNRFGTRTVQARLQWRFLNSSIPVRARVYFYAGGGARTVGYVERIMVTGVPNGVGTNSFTVLFAGQNWSLREIWFYGFVPTHITNDTYTIRAYTLGYVLQFVNGVNSANNLVGFSQSFITLFIANEADITVPIFGTPQSFIKTPEYDHAIGQVFSGTFSGAETANLSAGVPTLLFAIFGFGGMQLSNATECQTNVFLRGPLSLCGQGHFYYTAPDGTNYFDYGLDVGNYTAAMPEFGFNIHFLQVFALPTLQFKDLFLQSGVFLKAIQMAIIMQGPVTVVAGWIDSIDVTPLSWARVRASNSTYSRSVPTFDGRYDGVGALFLPAGAYNITFTDVQYQSQIVPNFQVGWGGSYSLPPPKPLCPTGSVCP